MNFDSDQKYWLSFWAMVLTTACIIVISVSLYNYNVTSEAIKAGLEERPCSGKPGYYWAKPAIKAENEN